MSKKCGFVKSLKPLKNHDKQRKKTALPEEL